MMDDTKRRTALVTGAGRGIGRGIAVQLSKNGYDVGIHYNTSEKGALETAELCRANGARVVLFQADIRYVEEIRTMFDAVEEKLGALDLMVCNAGITRFQPFLEATPEMFDTVLSTDLRGSFFCAQGGARNMVRHEKHGAIILISSNHMSGCWPHASFYAAAKAGLEKAGKNMALELAEYGIRVVTIAPGYTASADWPRTEGRSRTESRIPAGRFATPEEIGDAVVFLASDKAGYITGTTLFIDGGALLPVLTENRFV
ncbi:MAG: SDR family oxidoreductase [Firmicutes bacterium]|nr:SDR family oxidoreductase [Bacillota bacterium]